MHGEILGDLGLESGDMVIAQRIPLAEEIKRADLIQPANNNRDASAVGNRPMTEKMRSICRDLVEMYATSDPADA